MNGSQFVSTAVTSLINCTEFLNFPAICFPYHTTIITVVPLLSIDMTSIVFILYKVRLPFCAGDVREEYSSPPFPLPTPLCCFGRTPAASCLNVVFISTICFGRTQAASCLNVRYSSPCCFGRTPAV